MILTRSTPLARMSALLGALLLIEIVTRAFVWSQQTTFEPGIGYVLASGPSLWGREGWAISHWRPHGVRRSTVFHEGGRNVLVIGDSFTEAVHVRDEQTFTDRLAHALDTDLGANIVAVGRAGATLPHYIVWRDRWLALFAPAAIVVQVNDNDFEADSWDESKSHFRMTPAGSLEVVPVRTQAYQGLMSVLWHGRQLSMAFGILPARVSEYRAALSTEAPLFRAGDVPAQGTQPLPARHEPLPSLRALVDAYGNGIVIVHLPDLDPRDPDSPTLTERALSRACATLDVTCVMTRPELAQFVHRTHRSPFGFGENRFGEGHLNPDGHAIVGRMLAPSVTRALRRN